MSKIAISGAATGTATFTIESPATSTNRTLTLPDNTGTIITQNSTPAFASTIGVGGATAAASGAGITFPATQSASSDANTLDDYEEGTFTPTYAPSSGSFTSVTYTDQVGSYVKIGRVVFYNIVLRTSAITVGGASGQVQIHGFPFTVGSTNQAAPSAFAGRSSVWAGEEPFAFTLFPTTTTGELYYKNAVDGDLSNIVIADLGTGASDNRLAINGFYYV